MLSFRTGLPQYKNSLSKAQIPVYFQKIVDRAMIGATITQQLRRKVCLRSEKRAAFTFRQQHHYFSSIFADGNRTVNLFYIKPQRVSRMRRKIEENTPFKTLACSTCFAVILRNKPQRAQRDTGKYQTISQPP